MKYSHRTGLGACVSLLAAFGAVSGSYAIWVRPGEPVPVDRLLVNTREYLKQNPKDAKGYYLLGRLHSLLYARGMVKVALYTERGGKPLPLPEFPSYESVILQLENPGKFVPSRQAIKDLHESIRNYRRATELNPKEGLYYLGLGWVLEQASLLGRRTGATLEKNNDALSVSWRNQALAAYRKAYKLSVQNDQNKEPIFMGVDVVSVEAAGGIGRLQEGRTLTAKEKQELAQMRETVRAIQMRPHAVTPIVFPLRANQTKFDALLSRGTVKFDLAGDGAARQWGWVKPDVGLLVWDPEKSGRITSGRQLFGSVTWWMFWDNGYEPLAALDNNQDGWLTGRELSGIAVWQDRNSNGLSDRGEVVTVQKFGVRAIAVKSNGKQAGVLMHSSGIVLQDGDSLPTFDWVPVGK